MEPTTTEQPIGTLSASVTRETYWRFFLLWMLRRRKSYFVNFGLLLLLAATAIVLMFVTGKTEILAGVFPLLLVEAFMLMLPKRYYDQHREMYQNQTVHAFYEAHFHSSCDAMGTRHYKVTPYEHCYAEETKWAFYLTFPARRFEAFYWGDYFDPDPYNASAILDKQNLTAEQQQTLRYLFTRKFGKKFKHHKR